MIEVWCFVCYWVRVFVWKDYMKEKGKGLNLEDDFYRIFKGWGYGLNFMFILCF